MNIKTIIAAATVTLATVGAGAQAQAATIDLGSSQVNANIGSVTSQVDAAIRNATNQANHMIAQMAANLKIPTASSPAAIPTTPAVLGGGGFVSGNNGPQCAQALINDLQNYRKSRGLKPLTWDNNLADAAHRKSQTNATYLPNLFVPRGMYHEIAFSDNENCHRTARSIITEPDKYYNKDTPRWDNPKFTRFGLGFDTSNKYLKFYTFDFS